MKKLSLIFLVTVLMAGLSCNKYRENLRISPNDILSAKKYDKIVVEIQSFNGEAPNQATLDNIKTFMEQRLNKPGGITFIQTTINPARKQRYSLEDISNIEKENRTRYSKRNEVSIYFLFIDGEYDGNTSNSFILGIAYKATSMVIFHHTISQYSGGVAQPGRTALETAVSLHEFGHILGLVNNGTGMQTGHEDPDHSRHCNNKNCLMYYAAETNDYLSNFTGNIPSLDANCIQDLQSNGGK